MSITETRERPILFNDEMVRAILEGRKTLTRRPVKVQPPADAIRCGRMSAPGDRRTHGKWFWMRGELDCCDAPMFESPFGSPGDRLWVREAWGHDGPDLETVRQRFESASLGGTYGPYYRATESYPESIRWRPSIHMPRWASRLTLEVKAIRVEMVREISRWDIDAEGCPFRCESDDGDPLRQLAWFERSWDSIYSAKGLGWDANPWVWVVEFERVKS